MKNLAALSALILLSLGTCYGSSGYVIKDRTNGRTLEFKVYSLRQCPNRNETVLRWLATNSTNYKYGYEKLYHHDVTSNTHCQQLCTKVDACAMYEFHPKTKRCIVTTTRPDRSSEIVETGKWMCTYKETPYFFPMESMTSTTTARKLIGYGANGTVKQNIKLVNGIVGKALYLNGQGLIDLGSRRNECLGNLEMCKNGLTVSFWMKVKMPPKLTKHDSNLKPLKISKKDMTSRVSLFTTNDISVYFENGELCAKFKSGQYTWTVKVTVGFFMKFMRRLHEDPRRATWFFVAMTWHKNEPLTIWLNHWLIAKGPKMLDASESNGPPSSVHIGNIKPPFDSRPVGRALLDELRIWDTSFSAYNGGRRLYGSEMTRVLSERTRRPAKIQKSRARRRKSKQLTYDQGQRKRGRHVEHIPGVPDCLYHFSMDKMQGTTVDGDGTTGKVVGSCKLSQGQRGHALLLGPTCYIDFGYKQSECVGNFKLCKGGFSMSLWYHERSRRGESVMYHMSSGGKNPSVIIQAAYPKLRLQVLVGRRAWYQEIRFTDMGGYKQFLKTTWRHLIMTWGPNNGIKVYLEGHKPRSSSSSVANLALEGKLKQNERDNMIMGVPPGLKQPKVKRSMFSMFRRSSAEAHKGKIEIDELRFWDRELSKAEASAVFAYDNDKARFKVHPTKKVRQKKRSRRLMSRLFG